MNATLMYTLKLHLQIHDFTKSKDRGNKVDDTNSFGLKELDLCELNEHIHTYAFCASCNS